MPLDSIRAGGAFVRAHGRLAISISTRPMRSVSADGCRKSGWLTTASCRLSDGRVRDVWSVTVYVRSVLITSTVDPSKRYTRSYLAGGLARTLCRQTGRAERQEGLDGEREPSNVLTEVSEVHPDAVGSPPV